MKARCERVQLVLPDVVRGDADESTRSEALSHAQSCPDCGSFLHFIERLQSALTEDPVASPPPVYFEGVLAEIHRRMPAGSPKIRPARGFRLQPQAFASMVMVSLCFIWLGACFGPGMTQTLSGWAWSGEGRLQNPRHSAGAEQQTRPALVFVPRLGLVAEGSEVLRASPEFWREIGLSPLRVRSRKSQIGTGG